MTTTTTLCPRCGGLNGTHSPVHVRHGNGGGHNEPCPNEPCYRLESVEHGPLPADYPLQIGSIAKFPGSGQPPQATWNPDTGCWVSMRWAVVPDPRTRLDEARAERDELLRAESLGLTIEARTFIGVVHVSVDPTT